MSKPPAEQVQVGAYTGVLAPVAAATCRESLAGLSGLLASPAAETLTRGRNRNVRLRLETTSGQPLDVVVKAFGRQTLLKDRIDRARGTKAFRTWRAAEHLARHGVGTPQPIGYLERRQSGRLAESYFISRYLDGVASFREELIRLFREDPECWKFMSLLGCVASAIRALHTSGLLHNDLGNQNILLRRRAAGQWGDVQFIDLNRARVFPVLSTRQRARDLSRIHLPSDLLRVFREMYGGDEPPSRTFLAWERRYRKAYAVHASTRRIRHPLRTRRRRREQGPATAVDYPAPRDMWIWDERSAQAISTMVSRDRKRYYSPSWVLRPAAATLGGVFPVWKATRDLLLRCYRLPVSMNGRIGVAVDPRAGPWPAEKAVLDALGDIPVFVRLYCHEDLDARRFRLQAVREMAAAGRSVSIALVQDRRAVREPGRWRRFCEDVLANVSGDVEGVEVGHAINRVKWGIWSFAEHRALLETAADVASACPGLKLTGPGVIDFEYPFLMAALRNVPASVRFSALSHHLYVDRRGAPENRQGRFAALEKFALARAVARWSKASEESLIVSEVNWPLAGTGVYSPVGSPYESPGPRYNDPSVDEQTYAAYLVRYLAIALCSGMVDRVYWWRLVARGFGLVDDTDPARLRERPAYRALRLLLGTVGETTFVTRALDDAASQAAGVHVLLFETGAGGRVGLAWSAAGPVEVRLPFPCRRVTGMLGRDVSSDVGAVMLGAEPVYLHL